jgi:uncharacterized protein (TIGR03435 family)
MLRRLSIGALAVLAVLSHAGFALRAQLLHPTGPLPSFEVATVKPWQPPVVSSSVGTAQKVEKVLPVGAAAPVSSRIGFTGQIELLIESAYGLPVSSDSRILGGPAWIRNESDRYQISAQIDPAEFLAIQKMIPAQQRERVSLMQQSLLADRFKFKAHIETREMPTFSLTIANGGVKLERAPADAKSRLSFVRKGSAYELSATAVTLEELAQSQFLQTDKRQILDKTGLQGRFNFTLSFKAQDDSSAPELPTALQEQLGLKLTTDRAPVEVIIIDHIERPSEN